VNASVGLKRPHGDPRLRPSSYGMWLQQVGLIAICATLNLLLQHPDDTLATHIQKQLKHLKHTSETLVKHQKIFENTCAAIAEHM
jgi:gamma-glutamyl-gamma-aminobutyrate hydrolase PuuD